MTKKLKSKVFIPENYKSNLSLIETEIAIKKVKDFFETKLAETLNLTRVSAPLFLENNSGLNDNLNGVERPVSFDMLAIEDSNIAICKKLYPNIPISFNNGANPSNIKEMLKYCDMVVVGTTLKKDHYLYNQLRHLL